MELVADRIHFSLEDLLETPAGALVVPTDSSLTRREGITARIHRAAGKELIQLCRKAGPLAEGDALLTPGFALEGRSLIHVVLPRASRSREDLIRVRKAYWEILRISEENMFHVIGIPPMVFSEGGLNPVQSAFLALETLHKCLPGRTFPHQIRFCCSEPRALRAFERAHAKLAEDSLEHKRPPG